MEKFNRSESAQKIYASRDACTPILVGVVSSVSEIKISLWSIKVEKFNRSESAQKIHATRGRCDMHTQQFWWALSLRFWRYGYPLKTAKFPFWGMDYSPWSWKDSIDRNRLKKFMQVGIDVKCMHTNFDGCGLSGFGNMATFQKRPNFPFGAWTIVHGHGKIQSIRIDSKNLCM